MSTKKIMQDTQARTELAEAMSASSDGVMINQPKVGSICVEVEGTASLIQNAFSQKAIEEMLKKHMGISVQREKKKPREVIEAAIIRNVKGEVCMPVTAFKAAMLTASAGVKSFDKKKTQLKTQLFIEGSAVPIKFEKMTPRMDMVRTSGMSRTPDVRFRPEFSGWKACFSIQFVENLLTHQSVVDLVARAGHVGVGEWRPEKQGSFGTFRVSRVLNDLEEIVAIKAACAVPLKTPTIPEWALDMNIDPMVLAKVFDSTSHTADADDGREEEMETALNGAGTNGVSEASA
jgi:hypothetical protein